MIKTVPVGDQFPDLPHLGDVLPLGSVVTLQPGSRDRYIQIAPRTWVHSAQRETTLNGYQLSVPLFLESTPEHSNVELPPESASMFKWRLRDTAIAAAERSSISRGPVQDMVASIGAASPLFTIGGVVSNNIDISRLSVGTVVYSGHPTTPSLLNVWTMFEDGLRHTLGPQTTRPAGQPVTIYSMPEPPAQPTDPPATDEEWAMLALRAWRIGRTYQKRHRWCSVFDQTLLMLGITEKVITSTGESIHGPGDTLNRAQTALLPEGSLLWWQWRNGQSFAAYVRDNRAGNKSRTRRVFGSGDQGDQSHERMVVVKTPAEAMVWNVYGRWLAAMPDGTVFYDNYDNTRTEVTLNPGVRSSLSYPWHHYTIVRCEV